MALIQIQFYSQVLARQTNILVVVPQRNTYGEIGIENNTGENKYKTLLLLHGLSDDNTSAYMLEQAGRQIAAGYSGDWMATGTKAQIKDTMEADPEFKRNWDERVGDRMIKLVFIGKDMNQDKIIADLDACLVEARL